MNNLYTEIETILSEPYISEEYEITEMVDAPILCVREKDGKVTFEGEVDQYVGEYIVKQYKFDELLPALGVGLSLIGYVVGREFFLFSLFQEGEEHEKLPQQRASFMEFFNLNMCNVKLRHVPVYPMTMKFDGAKAALANKCKFKDVAEYTKKSVVELCGGISQMTKTPRKGMAFRSLTSNFSFKCYSEFYMKGMG